MYAVSSWIPGAVIALAFAVPAVPVFGATVSIGVEAFAMADLAGAQAAYGAYTAGVTRHVAEDFESLPSWDGMHGMRNPVPSRVGDIRGVSALPGSGGSAVNGGTGLEVQEDRNTSLARSYVALSGRQNTSVGGKNWLDSNDLQHMLWTVDAGVALGRFDSLAFFLTDVGDIRGTDFTIRVAGDGLATTTAHITPQANGTINFVQLLFDRLVTSVTVTLSSQRNDGFSLDDVTVAQVAPVPLPPAALALAAGLAGLALAARRGRRPGRA